MEINTTETVVLKGKVTFAKFGSSKKDITCYRIYRTK